MHGCRSEEEGVGEEETGRKEREGVGLRLGSGGEEAWPPRFDLIPLSSRGLESPLLLLPLPDPRLRLEEGFGLSPGHPLQGLLIKSLTPGWKTAPSPFHRMNVIWAKEKRRKIEVEKSLIWKFS